MFKRNYCMDILIENATSYTEKSKIYALTEDQQALVNDRMVGNLYQSALKRKDIDFGDIPNSKGDIEKFSGYANMVATVEMLKASTIFNSAILKPNLLVKALSISTVATILA